MKTLKISVTCPGCSTKIALPVTVNDVGTQKKAVCPLCRRSLTINIPDEWTSKFDSDPTVVGGKGCEKVLMIETLPNADTPYQTFELGADYYTVGRLNDSGPEFRPDIAVNTSDKKISRKHAAIRKKGNIGFTLSDMNSKNGVYHNDTRLTPGEEVYLADGDTFRIGKTLFRVSIVEHFSGNDDKTDV